METSNLKIFLSIGLSLIIFFTVNYIIKNPEKAKETLYQTPKNIISSVKTLNPLPFLYQITRKSLNLQNQKLSNLQQNKTTEEKIINNNTNYFNLPTAYFNKYTPPLPTPTKKINFKKTKDQENDTVLYVKKPTETPEPTKIPTPNLPKEYLRPGKSLEEIFKIAAEMSCVPINLLKAFIAQESPGVLKWSDEKALFYNTYDWWHRVTKKEEVCAGYGWYTETGIIAEDSLFAGERCKQAFNPTYALDNVSKSLGASQMLKYNWDKHYSEKVKQKLNTEKVDRRVLIDSLIALGISIRENGKYDKGCENWDFNDIIKAACINTGGKCGPYYCNVICRNYNKYANTNFNCEINMENLFKPGTCNFK